MTLLSSLFSGGGGAGVPVGGSLFALIDAPNPMNDGTVEYLRAGTIKDYDAGYAATIAAAPQLRVFGSDAKTYGTTVGTDVRSVFYIGTNYISMQAGGSSHRYGASLNNLASTVTESVSNTKRAAAAIGSTYLVAPSGTANVQHKYSINGSSFANVGGAFGVCPIKTAIASNDLDRWITLSSLNGTAGEQTYILAADPSGTWTVGASTNLGMTSVQAVAIDDSGVVVAAGTSASATTGKLASCPSVGGTWVDRTPSDVVFTTTGNVEDVVFDGTEFVAIAFSATNTPAAILTSPDGTTWTSRPLPVDKGSLNPLTGAISWAGAVTLANAVWRLTTDRAGTVVLTCSNAAAGRPVMFITTDHGVTWGAAQSYIGKVLPGTAARTMSYANGRWIYNHAGNYQSVIDIGTSLAVPDYIGQQLSLATGHFVRVK